jgi:Ca2+-binding RTX toxin-like protein
MSGIRFPVLGTALDDYIDLSAVTSLFDLVRADRAYHVTAAAGNDVVIGGRLGDLVEGGTGNDSLFGGAGDDLLYGQEGNDALFGGSGHDILLGGVTPGQDWLSGGSGNDTMQGSPGNDTLIGGTGADLMAGGAGADVFLWTSITEATAGSGRDRIADFKRGIDLISFEGIDTSAAPGDQDFVFIGARAFSGGAQVRYEFAPGGVMLAVDLNGDRAADMAIQLIGVSYVTASDFDL